MTFILSKTLEPWEAGKSAALNECHCNCLKSSDRHVKYDGTHRPPHPDYLPSHHYLALSYTRKDKELTCNLQPMEESLVQLRGEHDVTPIDAWKYVLYYSHHENIMLLISLRSTSPALPPSLSSFKYTVTLPACRSPPSSLVGSASAPRRIQRASNSAGIIVHYLLFDSQFLPAPSSFRAVHLKTPPPAHKSYQIAVVIPSPEVDTLLINWVIIKTSC